MLPKTTPTEIIAFGGWLYPIAKWLPGVRHISAPLAGFRESWCRDFANKLKHPATLIGFSSGGNAAMWIAQHSPMVRQAFVHSCEEKKFGFNTNCQYQFFVTAGDKTPTYNGTLGVSYSAFSQGIKCELRRLEFEPFKEPTWFERHVLAPRSHIFHNALPYLKSIGV